MSLQIRDVSVRFDSQLVLDHESLDVSTGEIVAVIGPSGSGKTTLLRVIAGLLRPDGGRVLIDREDVTDWPTHRRRVGLVFQDNQLFPHLDVADNVAFGLRMNRRSRPEIDARVAEVLDAVGLADRSGQSVGTLSGGEAKRVALARTLAPMPRVVLLDEPFAGLDDELRTRLAHDVRETLKRSGVTAILVSHDPTDVKAVADRVHHLADGVSIQRMPVESIRPLRREVLRAGMENQSVDFEGDDEATTFHLAALDHAGRIVATSTWLARERAGSPGRVAYQLRGMATAVDFQSRGLGARLVVAGLDVLAERGVEIVWANARDAALDFYRRLGFTVEGEGFIEPVTRLPHHVVVRAVNP
ncbi:MAG: GNAT family N-acetyltransferase [Ilumatobacteraceae bacterium]